MTFRRETSGSDEKGPALDFDRTTSSRSSKPPPTQPTAAVTVNAKCHYSCTLYGDENRALNTGLGRTARRSYPIDGSTSRAATVRRGESSPLSPSPDLTRGRRRRYAFVFIARFLPFRVSRLRRKRRSRLRRRTDRYRRFRAHARRRTEFLAAIPEEKIELSDRTKGKPKHESGPYTGLNRPVWLFSPDGND